MPPCVPPSGYAGSRTPAIGETCLGKRPKGRTAPLTSCITTEQRDMAEAAEADEFVFFDARDAALPPVDEVTCARSVCGVVFECVGGT
jgi:hypothetical protein